MQEVAMSSVVELFGNPVTAALSEWRNIVTIGAS